MEDIEKIWIMSTNHLLFAENAEVQVTYFGQSDECP